jgi:hypothetical protein
MPAGWKANTFCICLRREQGGIVVLCLEKKKIVRPHPLGIYQFYYVWIIFIPTKYYYVFPGKGNRI